MNPHARPTGISFGHKNGSLPPEGAYASIGAAREEA